MISGLTQKATIITTMALTQDGKGDQLNRIQSPDIHQIQSQVIFDKGTKITK